MKTITKHAKFPHTPKKELYIIQKDIINRLQQSLEYNALINLGLTPDLDNNNKPNKGDELYDIHFGFTSEIEIFHKHIKKYEKSQIEVKINYIHIYRNGKPLDGGYGKEFKLIDYNNDIDNIYKNFIRCFKSLAKEYIKEATRYGYKEEMDFVNSIPSQKLPLHINYKWQYSPNKLIFLKRLKTCGHNL